MKTMTPLKRAGWLGVCVMVLCATVSSSAGTKGIKAGFSWSNFTNTTKVTTPLETVFPKASEGSFFYYAVSAYSSRDILPELVSIQSELMYARGGNVWDVGDFQFALYTDYLQMPVFLKFNMPMWERFVPNIYIGPFVAMQFRSRMRNLDRVPAEIQANGPFFANLDLSSENVNYARNIFDAGFVTGLGFRIPLQMCYWDFDFRYQYGGLDVYNFPQAASVRNRMFFLMTGFSVDMGGWKM